MRKEDTSTGISWQFLPSNNFVESDIFVSSPLFTPSELAVSNVSASTPPGSSLSSRVPSGFSCVKAEQDYNNLVQQLQRQYVSPIGNIGSIGNVQFNDHAILEVGKGMLVGRQSDAYFDMGQTLFPQFSPDEDDARLKLLLEESLSSQNLRFPDSIGNRFAPQNDDAYRISLGLPDHFQPNNPSIYGLLHSQQFGTDMLTSNNHWDGRNHGKNFNGLTMSEVLNSVRLDLTIADPVMGMSNFKHTL